MRRFKRYSDCCCVLNVSLFLALVLSTVVYVPKLFFGIDDWWFYLLVAFASILFYWYVGAGVCRMFWPTNTLMHWLFFGRAKDNVSLRTSKLHRKPESSNAKESPGDDA